MADSLPKLVKVGKIVGVHGIRGAVKILCFTEDPKSITKYQPLQDEGGEEYPFKLLSMKKKTAVVALDGVVDRNKAETLVGIELFAPRDNLPEQDEDGWFYTDLEGLDVKTPEGELVGKVIGMHDFGAGDIVEVRFNETGKDEMFPFNNLTIPEIDIEGGFVVLDTPEEIVVKPGPNT